MPQSEFFRGFLQTYDKYKSHNYINGQSLMFQDKFRQTANKFTEEAIPSAGDGQVKRLKVYKP